MTSIGRIISSFLYLATVGGRPQPALSHRQVFPFHSAVVYAFSPIVVFTSLPIRHDSQFREDIRALASPNVHQSCKVLFGELLALQQYIEIRTGYKLLCIPQLNAEGSNVLATR